MATYQRDRFAEAATAYEAEYGIAPTANMAAAEAATTKANAAALADKLGEAHEAYTGLRAVATLRESIARRFIRLSVVPAAEVRAAAAAKAERAAKRSAKKAAA